MILQNSGADQYLDLKQLRNWIMGATLTAHTVQLSLCAGFNAT